MILFSSSNKHGDDFSLVEPHMPNGFSSRKVIICIIIPYIATVFSHQLWSLQMLGMILSVMSIFLVKRYRNFTTTTPVHAICLNLKLRENVKPCFPSQMRYGSMIWFIFGWSIVNQFVHVCTSHSWFIGVMDSLNTGNAMPFARVTRLSWIVRFGMPMAYASWCSWCLVVQQET